MRPLPVPSMLVIRVTNMFVVFREPPGVKQNNQSRRPKDPPPALGRNKLTRRGGFTGQLASTVRPLVNAVGFFSLTFVPEHVTNPDSLTNQGTFRPRVLNGRERVRFPRAERYTPHILGLPIEIIELFCNKGRGFVVCFVAETSPQLRLLCVLLTYPASRSS
jgi:hypothetical protein